MQVARDMAARVQQDLGLKQLPARLVAGLAELQVLTGEGIMQRAHRRLLATLRYHHPQRRFGGRCPLNARPMIAARSS